jgi:adenosylmethionine-8-amino-7-oxononanoate aminotransferase
MVVGKRLTGGVLPLSAVLAREWVYAAFLGSADSGRTFFHGHTYTANPLSCAAALANLALMHERGTVARAAAIGDRLGALLDSTAKYDGVAEVRRVGTMTGIEVRSVGTRTGFEVCRAARRRGVLVRPLGDVVVLMPPLGMSDDELDELVGAVDDAIREVVR